jgi:FkbM family methyltransferase
LSLLESGMHTLRDRGAATLAAAVCNLAYGNVQQQLLGRRFIARRVHDYRLWIDLEDRGISRTLLLFGTRELDHKAMLEQVLKPGMTVFDIGANIGYYVMMELGLIGAAGRMVAIEPSPANVALLRRNLALNGAEGRVTLVEGAVSNRAEERRFFLSEQSNLNTFHTDGAAGLHLSGESISVRTFTVPQLAEQHGGPDLIRMDVEGHEVEVIEGLLPAVEAGSMAPMIIFETHRSRYSAAHDMAAALRSLFACGYRVPLVASSSAAGTALVEARGYRGSAPIATDGVRRKLFADIGHDDAVDFMCHCGGVRTVLLANA